MDDMNDLGSFMIDRLEEECDMHTLGQTTQR